MKFFSIALVSLVSVLGSNSSFGACRKDAQGYTTCCRPQLAADICCRYDPKGKKIGCEYISGTEVFTEFGEQDLTPSSDVATDVGLNNQDD